MKKSVPTMGKMAYMESAFMWNLGVSQFFVMSVQMHQEIQNVHNDAVKALDHGLHQTLKISK